jgi:SAM-dependent methyltransferase
MNDWREGYIDEIAYTFGYCDELNPLRLKLALLNAGMAFPAVQTACELGFGYGVSVNIHAAGSTVRWYGADFNASHADFARDLATRARSQAFLFAEGFSEFCARDDLPEFDFIGMHGIWSWISAENRTLIVDFLSRKLKPGGVLYLSYNTQPGWTAMLPVRELLNQHFQASDAPDNQGMHERMEASIRFAQSVFATQPGYAVVNPHLAERLDALAAESPGYLAHEYFNRDWNLTSFSRVAPSLGSAGLSYAGSAHYREHRDELNLTPAQRTLLSGIADTNLKETVRDFCTNQSFRRDYWVKEPRLLNDAERQAALRAHRVVLALPRASVALKVRGTLGEVALREAMYGPILDALSSHRPATLGNIENSVNGHGISLEQIGERVLLLISMGVLLNAQDDAQIEAARPSSDRLNAAICERARHDANLQFLASPVSGSGIRMPRVAQLFLLARMNGLLEPAEWAEFAGKALSSSGPPDGVSNGMSTNAPDYPALIAQATRFAQLHLPILQALGVA